MATVELTGLSKRYGDTVAIEELGLNIEDREFFVILGPSGAGKTTTLKSVAGLVELDGGEVRIAGRSMDGVEPYHRNVAMAFESYALYPQKTVFDNLASPLRSGRTGTYSTQQQAQRIELVTTTLGINHLLQRFPRELSNGQRQRTALGRVLVRPADVYLLDEPLSHLDAKLRATMRAELKQIGEQSGITTLYVTHDYQEALALGHRIAVLRRGRVVQVGTPHEVWNSPVDSFVAKALGQPEINLLAAELADGEVVTAGGAVRFPAPAEAGLAAGDRVRVGLRPRDVHVANTTDSSDSLLRMSGTVRLAERLGRLIELDVTIGTGSVIVVTSSDNSPREGESVDLQVPLESVHLFADAPADEDSLRLCGAVPRSAATPELAESVRRTS